MQGTLIKIEQKINNTIEMRKIMIRNLKFNKEKLKKIKAK